MIKSLASLFLVLLILATPLPHYWPLFVRSYPQTTIEHTSLNFYLADIATAVLILLIFLRVKPGRLVAQVKNARYRPLSLGLICLVVVTAVSILFAQYPLISLFYTLRLGLLFILFSLIAQQQFDLRLIQRGVLGALCLQAAAAVVQFHLQDDLGLRWLGELDLNRYPGGGSVFSLKGDFYLRGYGITPHPNILGGVLSALILASIPQLLSAPKRERAVWLAGIGLGLIGLLVSFSRSAWLGAVVGGLFFAGCLLWAADWRAAYGRILLYVGVVSLLLLALVLFWQRDFLLVRFTINPATEAAEFGIEPTWARSSSERATLNKIGLQLIWDHFPVGVGAGNFAPAIAPLAIVLADVYAQPVHNLPILLTAEMGVFGGLLWVTLMIYPVAMAVIQLRRGELKLWTLGLTAALAALALIDLFDYYSWGWQQGRLLRWVIWGLWANSLR